MLVLFIYKLLFLSDNSKYFTEQNNLIDLFDNIQKNYFVCNGSLTGNIKCISNVLNLSSHSSCK